MWMDSAAHTKQMKFLMWKAKSRAILRFLTDTGFIEQDVGCSAMNSVSRV